MVPAKMIIPHQCDEIHVYLGRKVPQVPLMTLPRELRSHSPTQNVIGKFQIPLSLRSNDNHLALVNRVARYQIPSTTCGVM